MTQEDKDRIVGQTRREYREAKQTLAALRKQASTLGDRMSKVGHMLASEPENLIFAGQGHDGRFQPRIEILNVSEFSEVLNLLGMTNNIRESILKVEKLRQELIRLEGEDPETGNVTIGHSPSFPR